MFAFLICCTRSKFVVEEIQEGTWDVTCVEDCSAAAWNSSTEEGDMQTVNADGPREALIATGIPENNILCLQAI